MNAIDYWYQKYLKEKLTWKDVKMILVLTRKSIADALPHMQSDEELAKEVLKRFNEQREKK